MVSHMDIAALYGVRRSAQVGNDASTVQSPAGDYAVPARPGASQQVSSVNAPQAPTIAPTVSWVAVIAALVLIRVLHDRGARLE
jgi:hypothetical protein